MLCPQGYLAKKPPLMNRVCAVIHWDCGEVGRVASLHMACTFFICRLLVGYSVHTDSKPVNSHYLFGNLGLVEQGFLDALRDYPDLTYILTLQEAVTVGIADGYARATIFHQYNLLLINFYISIFINKHVYYITFKKSTDLQLMYFISCNMFVISLI